LFDEIGIMLCQRGLLMKEGTIVDATIIEAPLSTKNAEKSRDPEMHQTRKGNEWHFGMKAHVGVDADSGLVHSLVGTAANESDVSQAHALLHGHEELAFGDAGYTGVASRDEMQGKSVKWHVALKRGKIKAMRDGALKELLIAAERTKAQIRARVEHPFHVIKNLFRHRKVRYKGLAKNTAQLFSLFGLANLVLARKRLLPHRGAIRPERAKRARRRMEWRKNCAQSGCFSPTMKSRGQRRVQHHAQTSLIGWHGRLPPETG
jgi:IS5 family transposase